MSANVRCVRKQSRAIRKRGRRGDRSGFPWNWGGRVQAGAAKGRRCRFETEAQYRKEIANRLIVEIGVKIVSVTSFVESSGKQMIQVRRPWSRRCRKDIEKKAEETEADVEQKEGEREKGNERVSVCPHSVMDELC